jgi:caffeoyl-CoA O-methyltransferase
MQHLDKILQTYAEQHTEVESPLLAQIHQDTHAQIPMPQMLSGHLQGRLLAAFSYMLQPTHILEIGTYTGYSALCLAEGLRPGGTLHTIDKNVALAAQVRSYFAQSSVNHKIKYHIGQASDVIPQLDKIFDLVFIDADKRNYKRYYDLVFDRIRPGGFIVVDNCLWGGKVVTTVNQPIDKRTQAIMHFNAHVHRDQRVANVLLPIRDGLMILRKK